MTERNREEREALLALIDSAMDPGKSCQVDGCRHSTGLQDSGSSDWCPCHYHDDDALCEGEPELLPPYRERLADAILAADFRRTVRGEPTDALRRYLRTKGFNPSRIGNWDTSSGIGLAREAFLTGWHAAFKAGGGGR